MKVTTSIVKSLSSTRIKFIYTDFVIDNCKPVIMEHIFKDKPTENPPKKFGDDFNFRVVSPLRYKYDERGILEEQISNA